MSDIELTPRQREILANGRLPRDLPFHHPVAASLREMAMGVSDTCDDPSCTVCGDA